ncbi:MAG: radical SAM protein [Mariprofundaceae bacterium]|nr:radical SAM protein [Mariprofundaceae bacterium]
MEKDEHLLTTSNHDRNAAGLTYVYPVVSRRAGGVSIGVNLNPNNACNWHCVYCQVPDLVRGSSPDINIALLNSELSNFIDELLYGHFMQEHVPESCRRICDVAISGNGEPTSCKQFDTVTDTIIHCLQDTGLLESIPVVLITNGSYVHRPQVQQGLEMMAAHRGEVWFKVDSATDEGIERINGVTLSPDQLRKQLEIAATSCPTWIQTCMFNWDGQSPDETEITAYLDFLAALVREAVPVKGVLLYGVARPSMQPEAAHVSPLDEGWIKGMAQRIEAVGLPVKLSA